MSPASCFVAVPLALIVASDVHAFGLIRKAHRHARDTARLAAAAGDTEAEKTALYAADTHRDTLKHQLGRSVLLLTLTCGGAATLHDLMLAHAVPEYGELAVLLSLLAAFHITDLPFAFLRTFGTERRFGFNRSSFGTALTQRMALFFLDAVYSVALFLILRALYISFPMHGWLLAAPALILAVLLKQRFLPPAQHGPDASLKPLADSPLKTRLVSLCERAGLSARQILVFSAGKHTAHTQAYVTGVGAGVRIVLFDSLLRELEEDEVEAIVAHEIAHHTRRHIPYRIVGVVATRLPVIALCWLIGRVPHLTEALGFSPGDAEVAPVSILIALWFVFATPIMHWATPLLNAAYRRQEYEADAEAARLVGDGDALIRGLTKIHAQNRADENPHPEFAHFYATHPTGVLRLKALERLRFAR